MTYSSGSSLQTLDQGSIPFIDHVQHEFSCEIKIPDDRRDWLRMHFKYYGSGDISIDSLQIVYLGK